MGFIGISWDLRYIYIYMIYVFCSIYTHVNIIYMYTYLSIYIYICITTFHTIALALRFHNSHASFFPSLIHPVSSRLYWFQRQKPRKKNFNLWTKSSTGQSPSHIGLVLACPRSSYADYISEDLFLLRLRSLSKKARTVASDLHSFPGNNVGCLWKLPAFRLPSPKLLYSKQTWKLFHMRTWRAGLVSKRNGSVLLLSGWGYYSRLASPTPCPKSKSGTCQAWGWACKWKIRGWSDCGLQSSEKASGGAFSSQC